ncbi:MAG: hypothetical protein M3Q65_21030 [Chloroflexota bacterium]|nr:hypothetical protein [Chloroflexota bacterium]
MLFPLGRVVATPGALDALAGAGRTPTEFLARHAAGDWGDVGREDAAENVLSLARGFRLFSVYRYDPADPTAKVWIITEAEGSSTCVLLPSEY